MHDDFLWVEKYRPKTIEDCILPTDVKATFKSFVEQGEIPNLLLSGTAGVGKTTIAKALCNELGADFYVINGSDEGRFLDTVRNQAKTFASTVSLLSTSRHKVLSSMKRTTLPQMYNYSSVRRLKNFKKTVGSYSRLTLRTK